MGDDRDPRSGDGSERSDSPGSGSDGSESDGSGSGSAGDAATTGDDPAGSGREVGVEGSVGDPAAGADDPDPPSDERLLALHDDLVETLESAGDPRELSAYVGAISLKDLRTYSDREVFEVLLDAVFAPGRPWTEYRRYRSAVHAALGDYRRVAGFDETDVQRLLESTTLAEDPGRIRLAALNARAFRETVAEHGSVRAYLQRFEGTDRPGERAIAAVGRRFRLGPKGAREFLSNAGYRPVVRRERTLGRTLARVGVVPGPRAFDAVDRVVGRLSELTGRPWAAVDRLFWAHGFGPDVLGMTGPVCDAAPNCHRCLVGDCGARGAAPTER